MGVFLFKSFEHTFICKKGVLLRPSDAARRLMYTNRAGSVSAAGRDNPHEADFAVPRVFVRAAQFGRARLSSGRDRAGSPTAQWAGAEITLGVAAGGSGWRRRLVASLMILLSCWLASVSLEGQLIVCLLLRLLLLSRRLWLLVMSRLVRVWPMMVCTHRLLLRRGPH